MKSSKKYLITKNKSKFSLLKGQQSNNEALNFSTLVNADQFEGEKDVIKNIFETNLQKTFKFVADTNLQQYHVLGYKEVKQFTKQKKNKRNRNIHIMNSFQKQMDSYTQRSTIMDSNKKVSFSCLSKQQLLCRSSLSTSRPKRIIQCDVIKDESQKQKFKLEPIEILREDHIPNQEESRLILHKKFSVNKIKLKMNEYEKNWRDQRQKRLQRLEKQITKFRVNNKPKSILDSIEQYRIISLQKKLQQIKKTNAKQFLSDRQWGFQLRENCLNKKKCLTKIEKNGIMSSGSSKNRKELDWISKKNDEGFKFIKISIR